jgi:tRNA(Arg) A34 adenosine deaminase TadA
LANEARQGGSAPYGALVADADGKVIVERGNTTTQGGGDPTQHAELVASAGAWRVLGTDGMNQATLYASTERCVAHSSTMRPRNPMWVIGAKTALSLRN